MFPIGPVVFSAIPLLPQNRLVGSRVVHVRRLFGELQKPPTSKPNSGNATSMLGHRVYGFCGNCRQNTGI